MNCQFDIFIEVDEDGFRVRIQRNEMVSQLDVNVVEYINSIPS